ncbi:MULTISPECIES: hypothetical protein [Rhizobium]|nr:MULTISPECIES: hypothetical protein [Rhizobium]
MQSTYSAIEGDGIGDLTVLYKFKRLAEASGIRPPSTARPRCCWNRQGKA